MSWRRRTIVPFSLVDGQCDFVDFQVGAGPMCLQIGAASRNVLAAKGDVNRHRAHLNTRPTRAAFKHRSLPLPSHRPSTHPQPLLDNGFCSCARPGCHVGGQICFPFLGLRAGSPFSVPSTFPLVLSKRRSGVHFTSVRSFGT